MTIGEKVRKVRESTGLSIRAFAVRCQISHSSLSRIESGLTSPSYELLLILVKDFNVEPSWLFTDSSETMTVTPSKIDFDFMKKVMIMVDEEIADRQINVSPELRAKLVLELYKFCILDNAKAPEIESLRKIIKMVS